MNTELKNFIVSRLPACLINSLIVLAVHRIDRLTSGLVLFSKSSAYATTFARMLDRHHIAKEYVAKVKGSFPKLSSTLKSEILPFSVMWKPTFLLCLPRHYLTYTWLDLEENPVKQCSSCYSMMLHLTQAWCGVFQR